MDIYIFKEFIPYKIDYVNHMEYNENDMEYKEEFLCQSKLNDLNILNG